ncbi:LacI family transcriptional regulator [Capsulimonas corticalis]|uniref:LacI family transcriptional regulator n=1 Tax=Capsulimonas corticalis TaxID=2219043 RepID=A0A402D424_9BACT|nr:LacI family DNA-binding transcriptional regulator [Capsulimonas corticalis]BDI31175.1 LacI family transcriptional regulator [Capsulimonas corticalis]
MAKRATRADVAAKAGVSKTTVTYVLSDRYDFSIPESTRERVRAAAQSLGYQPHAAARALASGRTNSITIAVPYSISSHYARVLQAFERHANANGYHMIASTVGHLSMRNVGPDLAELLSNLTDGVVLVDMPAAFQPEIDRLMPSFKPVISMGVFTAPGIDSVTVDLAPGAAAALDHLLAAEPKRIAFISAGRASDGPERSDVLASYTGDARPDAYRDAMTRAGRPLEEIPGSPSSRQATMESLRDYVGAYGCPDALFCFNDDIAIAAYRTLREMGYRIPEDVRIVGCDGSEEGEYAFPALTTIAQPIDEMCALAWQFLAKRLSDPEMPQQRVTVDARFTIRGSTRP